jgi:hypothetical protein
MSVAVRVQDNTERADSSYVYWGGTTMNDAYWGVHYYGAVAELWNASTSIFPNYENGNINVFFSNDKLMLPGDVNTVDVYNLSGTKMISIDNPQGNINLNYLSRGVYLAKIKLNNGKVGVLKFVK